MPILKIAALALVSAVLALCLKKEQPVFALLISIGGAGAALALTMEQAQALVEILQALSSYGDTGSLGCVLRVLGIALLSQFAADLCREGGMAAAASAVELCGRMLAMMQALPMLQSLFASFSSFLG